MKLQEVLGGKLAELLDAHEALLQGEKDARLRLRNCQAGITSAEASDVAHGAARLHASALGHDGPPDEQDSTKAAIVARDAAERAVREHEAALYKSMIAIDAEAKSGSYDSKLAQREKLAMASGRGALKKVDASLADLSLARAARRWIADPADAKDRVRPLQDVQIGSTIVRPNGEPMAANTLTVGLAEVFEPPVTTQGDQRAPWGIPTNAVGPVAVAGQIVEPVPGWKAGVASGRTGAEALAEQAAST